MTLSYIAYFSIYTVLRYQTLWAHYFDLGIMHQTVYNTFMALKTGDYTRFLELTNPHGFDQVKRMAVHNDMILALLAPFYFLYSGPETLLIIQSIATGLGALAVYGISKIILEKKQNVRLISLFFSFAYLMYPPLQRANQFDFHAVVLATPLLLFMYFFYLKKKYIVSLLIALTVMLTKEQVGLTIAFFGIYIILQNIIQVIRDKKNKFNNKEFVFGAILILIGVAWFGVSMMIIIPYFRSGAHFALNYFGDFGDSPKGIFVGLMSKPILIFQYLFRKDAYDYLYTLSGPVGFLSILSPLHLLIATPELAINLISKSGAMRNIYFHYTTVTTPFIMISGIYGLNNGMKLSNLLTKYTKVLVLVLVLSVFYFSHKYSPLPYSLHPETHPFNRPAKERFDVYHWQKKLINENIKVMVTGHIAPLFASRRYLYNFSAQYALADYVVLSQDDVYNGYENNISQPAYEKLVKDIRFINIYKNALFEVYKKI